MLLRDAQIDGVAARLGETVWRRGSESRTLCGVVVRKLRPSVIAFRCGMIASISPASPAPSMLSVLLPSVGMVTDAMPRYSLPSS